MRGLRGLRCDTWPTASAPWHTGNHPDSGHAADRCCETALVPRRLVLVDDILVRDRINHAGGALKHAIRRSLVAGFDRLSHALDCATKLRAQTRIVLTLFFTLACALSG